ncbi:MAG TPA: FxLD family lanthipeptide [Micromonosporaceae bacterium]|nr:FxLD family lanthipeptide [Micromonosporaceae bacterium]
MSTAMPALQAPTEQTGSLTAAEFDLDITVVEQGDLGGLVRLTDDGCGSTCGACTTG